ncbi:MAG: hypothetical protein EPO11_10360, partial [Gammaproteobacteria bacterium]
MKYNSKNVLILPIALFFIGLAITFLYPLNEITRGTLHTLMLITPNIGFVIIILSILWLTYNIIILFFKKYKNFFYKWGLASLLFSIFHKMMITIFFLV